MLKENARYITPILFFLMSISCQSNSGKNDQQHKGMYSTYPAEQWQGALISGNGIMGIMVHGDPENEKVIFNHEFLYEPLGSTDVEPPMIGKYLAETRNLLHQKKYEEAINYSYEMAAKEDYAGLQWTDPYHPAMVMGIDQSSGQKYAEYKRSVNFESGEVIIEWSKNGIRNSRKSFVSREDNIIVQFVENEKSKVNCKLKMDMQGAKKNEWADRREFPKGYEDPEISYTNEWLTFRVKYTLNESGYEVVTKIVSPQGNVMVSDNEISIKDADHVMLISRIIPIDDYSQSSLQRTKDALDKIVPDYDQLLKKHAAIHGEIFSRVVLDIYPDEQPRHSSEELIANQIANPDLINVELLELMFNMGRYALLSSSGNNPPNLMGIWNGQWRPAWSGDFTTDANVNLQISSANICNMPEAIDSYMKMLERVAPDWEINARNLYGCSGYLAGPRTSGTRGLHTHFDVQFPGHFWLAGAQWLLLPCYEYYLVSGDVEFLQNRLLPMMEKTALFFEDFLSEIDENGNFFFAPSYSPENRPLNINVQASVNATMDIAAAKESFTSLIAVYNELDIRPEKRKKLKELLQKFPPYLINDHEALKEWAVDDLIDNNKHRHVSHLYPVWPGHEINPEQTPELFKAAVKAAEMRERGNESAHGLMHMALIGARLKNPEIVHDNLQFVLSRNFLYPSLFTSHNPNLRIYNSDALCSLPAVIAESLVYSRPGFIELIPALSSEFPPGRATNLQCRSHAVVKELTWDMKKEDIEFSIYSRKKQDIKLLIRHYAATWTEHGKTGNFSTDKGKLVTVSFEKGETKAFSAKLRQ